MTKINMRNIDYDVCASINIQKEAICLEQQTVGILSNKRERTKLNEIFKLILDNQKFTIDQSSINAWYGLKDRITYKKYSSFFFSIIAILFGFNYKIAKIDKLIQKKIDENNILRAKQEAEAKKPLSKDIRDFFKNATESEICHKAKDLNDAEEILKNSSSKEKLAVWQDSETLINILYCPGRKYKTIKIDIDLVKLIHEDGPVEYSATYLYPKSQENKYNITHNNIANFPLKLSNISKYFTSSNSSEVTYAPTLSCFEELSRQVFFWVNNQLRRSQCCVAALHFDFAPSNAELESIEHEYYYQIEKNPVSEDEFKYELFLCHKDPYNHELLKKFIVPIYLQKFNQLKDLLDTTKASLSSLSNKELDDKFVQAVNELEQEHGFQVLVDCKENAQKLLRITNNKECFKIWLDKENKLHGLQGDASSMKEDTITFDKLREL